MRITKAFLSIMLIVVVSASPVFSQTPDEAERLGSLVVKHYEQGRYREAIPLAERALAIYEKSLRPDHPDIAGSLNDLAALYHIPRGRTSPGFPGFGSLVFALRPDESASPKYSL